MPPRLHKAQADGGHGLHVHRVDERLGVEPQLAQRVDVAPVENAVHAPQHPVDFRDGERTRCQGGAQPLKPLGLRRALGGRVPEHPDAPVRLPFQIPIVHVSPLSVGSGIHMCAWRRRRLSISSWSGSCERWIHKLDAQRKARSISSEPFAHAWIAAMN